MAKSLTVNRNDTLRKTETFESSHVYRGTGKSTYTVPEKTHVLKDQSLHSRLISRLRTCLAN